ncbi:MAG TPA: TIGR03435 family protein [Bryobacteraceae bacterium]|jgi:uncharacterized protein (TIGR03435 family)
MKSAGAFRGFTLLTVSFLCLAQSRDARREFDVATIHLVKLESRQFPPTSLRRDPARIAYDYVFLDSLVRQAYNLPNYRMEWPERLAELKQGLYSISATFPEHTTDTELQGMLQRLLEDQLALRTHWVSRNLPGYELTASPDGAKLRHSTFDPAQIPGDPFEQRERNRYTIFQGPNGWRFTGVISMAQFTASLGTDLGRPLLDKTGLAGYYEIDFTWNRPSSLPPPTPPGQPPSFEKVVISEKEKTATLFPALEKQLGLKAAPVKLLVDVLVIDSVERTPSGGGGPPFAPPRPPPRPKAGGGGASGIFAVPPTFIAVNCVPVENPTYSPR